MPVEKFTSVEEAVSKDVYTSENIKHRGAEIQRKFGRVEHRGEFFRPKKFPDLLRVLFSFFSQSCLCLSVALCSIFLFLNPS
jgi:hypothetical protein